MGASVGDNVGGEGVGDLVGARDGPYVQRVHWEDGKGRVVLTI